MNYEQLKGLAAFLLLMAFLVAVTICTGIPICPSKLSQ